MRQSITLVPSGSHLLVCLPHVVSPVMRPGSVPDLPARCVQKAGLIAPYYSKLN